MRLEKFDKLLQWDWKFVYLNMFKSFCFVLELKRFLLVFCWWSYSEFFWNFLFIEGIYFSQDENQISVLSFLLQDAKKNVCLLIEVKFWTVLEFFCFRRNFFVELSTITLLKLNFALFWNFLFLFFYFFVLKGIFVTIWGIVLLLVPSCKTWRHWHV